MHIVKTTCLLLSIAVAFTTAMSADQNSKAIAENPYATFLQKQLEGFNPMPPMPHPQSSAMQSSDLARDMRLRAWGATDLQSGLSETIRDQLSKEVVSQMEYLIAQLDEGRWWWQDAPHRGDPNMNRFILAPALQTIRMLMEVDGINYKKMAAWKASLLPAVEFQYNSYGQRTVTDWSSRLAGAYPNMDAAYILIMGLAAKLYDEPRYADSAEAFIERMRFNLLPSGSVRYTGDPDGGAILSNAAPVYTGVVVSFLAQYYAVTKSASAREFLIGMHSHYPRVWLTPGIPENTTSSWWKHTGYRNRLAFAGIFEPIAALAGCPYHRYFADRLIELGRFDVNSSLLALEFYRPDIPAKAPPENVILPDPDIVGFRGRFADHMWVGSLGPNQDSLVGWLSVLRDGSHPNATPEGLSFHAVSLITPEVGLLPYVPGRSLFRRAAFITGQEYPGTSMIADSGGFAVLAAHYNPRQATIFKPENEPTYWRVTQVWFFVEQQKLGLVQMQHMTETRSDEYVRLRIRTEHENQLREIQAQRLFRNGPLDVEILMTDFPTTRHGRAELTDHRSDQPHADEIFLEEHALNGHVGSEGDIVYNSVISVRKAGEFSPRVVRMIQQGDHLVGLQFLLEGKDYVILYNTGNEPMETAFLNELTGSLNAVDIYRTTLRGEKVQRVYVSDIKGLEPIKYGEIVILQF
jgi:hypothetical protein